MKYKVNAALVTDGYKFGHRAQYPDNTTFVHSNMTSRSAKLANIPEEAHNNKVVFFGMSYSIQELQYLWDQCFFKLDEDAVVDEYVEFMIGYLGNPEVDSDHIRDLHKLGYLPIRIRALPEGTRVPIQVPAWVIESTVDEFAWITNYLETFKSTTLWGMQTSATLAFGMRRKLEQMAELTGANKDFVPFQGHDFSFRGLDGFEAAYMNGMAFLTSFNGSDTAPAIVQANNYYDAKGSCDIVGMSVNATEHSVMCAGTKGDEIGTIKRLITEVYPSGIVSIVSDTWDFWKVLTEFTVELKDDILARDGKVVFRPDSGDPAQIICGDIITDFTERCSIESVKEYGIDVLTDEVCEEQREDTLECGRFEHTGLFKHGDKYFEVTIEPFWNRHDKTYYYFDGIESSSIKEVTLTPEQKGAVQCLWDEFGGTTTDKGYKTLDQHVGLIYGDSINYHRLCDILHRLEQKGFSSDNLVFGIGSYSLGYKTRDTYGMAVKATFVTVDGEHRAISKDPKTGSGKKSAKGLLAVLRGDDGELYLRQEIPYDEYINGVEGCQFETVFENGKHLIKPTFGEIRDRLLAEG